MNYDGGDGLDKWMETSYGGSEQVSIHISVWTEEQERLSVLSIKYYSCHFLVRRGAQEICVQVVQKVLLIQVPRQTLAINCVRP